MIVAIVPPSTGPELGETAAGRDRNQGGAVVGAVVVVVGAVVVVAAVAAVVAVEAVVVTAARFCCLYSLD